MEIIKRNPYRVLGVLANASEREIKKQQAINKRYAEVGKSKSFDTDFTFIGDLSRSVEDVQYAAGQIEQAHKKIHYALFWFVNSNSIDDIAINNLKDGNQDKAIEVWTKALKSEVSGKNYSSYHNLSTLYIAMALAGTRLDLPRMNEGIELKGELLSSNSFASFLDLIGCLENATEQDVIAKQFVDNIVEIVDPLLGRDESFKSKRIVTLFDTYPKYVTKYVTSKYSEFPILNIESEISKAAQKRKQSPENANEYGLSLFNSAKDDIAFLKSLLGSDDVQIQMLVDKTANEIMQCSIDFYNEGRDSDHIDPGYEALKIAGHAKSIGPVGQVKKRVDENTATIQEWVNEKPNRDKQNRIAEEVEYLALKLKEFKGVSITKVTMAAISNLVRLCKPKLASIKSEIGSSDEFYLQVSDAVVSHALSGLIYIFNTDQEKVVEGVIGIETVRNKIRAIIDIIDTLRVFDMSATVRSRVNKNRNTIVGMESEIERAVQKSSSGCYIATMAYGDYNHPQVVILREYRDQVLSKYIFGRLFIKIYYGTSPYLVKYLSGRDSVHFFIRKLIDQWIKAKTL